MNHIDDQPTLYELKANFNHAMSAAGQPYHRGQLISLRILRDAKHTWVGNEENSLRFDIDNYLREYKP